MDPESQARDLAAKAGKKLAGMSLFGNKYEDAAELLSQAANYYKLAKNWNEAAQTNIKLAEVQLKLESKHDAASAWVEAANCYRRSTPREAKRCLDQAVQLYMQLGRLGVAARHLKDAAEVAEKEGDKEGAIELYEKAADLYEGENSATTDLNKCRLKIAQFSAELEDFDRATTLFEDVAKSALESNLLKYSAKGYLLNAALCVLNAAVDVDEIKLRFDKYRDMDMSFSSSREDDMLTKITEAIEESDPDMFAEAVQEYDSMSRLDAFRTQMLLKAKKRLQSGAFGGDDDLT